MDRAEADALAMTNTRIPGSRLAMALALAVGALSLAATSAYASGGADSGGSGGGGSTTSGGGGGGGSTTSGGGSTTTSTSCTKVAAFSNSTGYYSVWAAVWTSVSFTTTCSGGATTWSVTYVNNNTGAQVFWASGSTSSGWNGTVDEDWCDFSTPYTVTLTLTDGHGTVQYSQALQVTTPAPKAGA